jgi:hypothetical protein
MKLFAVPNAWLGTEQLLPRFRLLRVRYYAPWRSAPDEMRDEPALVQWLFFVARLTGFLVPAALVGFFLSAFLMV